MTFYGVMESDLAITCRMAVESPLEIHRLHPQAHTDHTNKFRLFWLVKVPLGLISVKALLM